MNPIRQHIEDILTNILAIERFTADGREVFLTDDKTQYAVIRACEIIGEVLATGHLNICAATFTCNLTPQASRRFGEGEKNGSKQVWKVPSPRWRGDLGVRFERGR